MDLSGSLEGAGGIGGLLDRTDSTASGPLATAYYHSDGNGNVTLLLDGAQNVAARYDYDPFGNTLALSGPLAAANVYRFSSKEVNPATGLYAFGERFYHPNLQRWLNRDSIGVAGGVNLYAYVGNQACCAIDPWGLLIMFTTDEAVSRKYGIPYMSKANFEKEGQSNSWQIGGLGGFHNDDGSWHVGAVYRGEDFLAAFVRPLPTCPPQPQDSAQFSNMKMWADALDAWDDLAEGKEQANILRDEVCFQIATLP